MEDINILVFGDSIVYGACDNEKLGWVNRLRQTLENEKSNYYNIYNLGIPGDTTNEIKKRFEFEYKNRCNKDMKNIIFFSIGINDSYIIDGKNNVSLETFKDNIIDLINMSKKYTENILFMGLSKVNESLVHPVSWDKNISYSNKEIAKFDRELKSICKNNNISYINTFDLLDIEDLQDGLHPTGKGHQKLCDEVLKCLMI